jgi:hypothetical protein
LSATTLLRSDQESRIPIIDVASFLAGEPEAAEILATQVAWTCCDTGFLVMTNHGVPQPVIDRAFAAAAVFFALDEESKLALKISAENIGYLPYGGQTVRTSTVHRNTKQNYSELVGSEAAISITGSCSSITVESPVPRRLVVRRSILPKSRKHNASSPCQFDPDVRLYHSLLSASTLARSYRMASHRRYGAL